MHLIALIEHSSGDWEKLQEWIHSIPVKNLKGETTYPCCRELRLLDITLDESCVDQLLERLPKGTGHVNPEDVDNMREMIQAVTPLQSVDLSKMGTKTLNNQKPPQTFCYFIILGAIPDRKNKEGLDLL